MRTNRREFLKSGLLIGAGLIVGCKRDTVTKIEIEEILTEINPFVMIDTKGIVTIVNSRIEMGQGALQAVTALIAEELDVPADQVKVVPSGGQDKFGSQHTGASSTVRAMSSFLRKEGATARTMLIQAAANRWKVSSDNCYASEGKILLRNSGESFTYGELVLEASKLSIPENVMLKDPKDYKLLDKSLKRPDVPSKTNGTARYAIDEEIPDMLYAVSIHSPLIKNKIVSFDASKALAHEDVVTVIKSERYIAENDSSPHELKFSLWAAHKPVDTIAVVAKNYWTALKASKLVEVKWESADLNTRINTDDYIQRMHACESQRAIKVEESQDFKVIEAKADIEIESTYETPFLAHASIEPVNCLAWCKDNGTAEIWASHQGADTALNQAAEYLQVDVSKLKIHSPLLGGSFGRKGIMDFMKEAIDISRKVKKPVKLIWPREDDMAQGPFRPAMLSKMKAHINKVNENFAMSHHAIGESIQGQNWKGIKEHEADTWIAGELGSNNIKYKLPGYQLLYSRVKTEIPVMWWRSVYSSNLVWGHECFIDEIAHKLNKDPLEFRWNLLDKQPRERAMLKKLKEILATETESENSAKYGLAMTWTYDSISLACIWVSKNESKIKIEKVVSIMDCGFCLNPGNTKAQIEGCIVMGLSAAIYNGISITDGKIQQSNFHNYPVMRMSEVPGIETYVMDSNEKSGGVGEPSLPAIAPALGNAIFNLTGVRQRKLPISLRLNEEK